MTDPSPRDLDGDILAYLAGDLDDAALDALDQRVREDQAVARRFAELSTREVLLSSVLRMRAGHPDHPSTRLPRLLPRPAPPRRMGWQWGLAAAALVLASTVIAVVSRRSEPPAAPNPIAEIPAPASFAAVATVVEIAGSAEARRGDRAIALAAGSGIAAGDRIVVAHGSRIGLSCSDGTRLDLGPSTTLAFATRASDGLELDRGELAATVTHRQAGAALVFATAHARAEVLGTRLVLAANADATRLRVDEGRVRMTRRSDGAVADIDAAHAATATARKDRPFLSVRVDSLAGALALGSDVRFATTFADSPEPWPGAQGCPPGRPLGTVAIRTMRVEGGRRDHFEMHGRSGPGDRTEPITIAGDDAYVGFRYVTERFASSDLIEVVATSELGLAYRCRVRPRFETSTSAVVRLDRSFTARGADNDGDRAPLPPGTAIASLTWRVVGADGMEAGAGAQLWLEDAVGFTSQAAVETAPTVGIDAVSSGYHRAWDFDREAPADMSVIGGSWHRLPEGGVDGSGCMQVDTPALAVSLDVPPPTVPVRITFDHSPCLPDDAGTYSVFVQWDSFRSLTQLRDISEQLVLPVPVTGQVAYERVFEYLLPDHMEVRQRGERAALSFYQPEAKARLQLLVIGLNRIDNLRIDEIDPAQAPPVDDMRAALAKLGDQRPGTIVTLPIPAADPAHPPRADFRRLVPGTSPWIVTDDPPAP